MLAKIFTTTFIVALFGSVMAAPAPAPEPVPCIGNACIPICVANCGRYTYPPAYTSCKNGCYAGAGF
ncbi:hypothetical protein HDV00_005936 [Rhizophlyctis rosea]|nr:hypothetical protein HDV00_005936 [Rhizophlyctis rosea]